MEISIRVRRAMFAVLLASCVISSAVQTALNTALTPIMQEMNITAGTAQWLSSSYSLVMGVMVLATAYMIKRFKNRSLYLLFMSLFTVGLIMSALAPTFAVLLSGRLLQAAGTGLLMSLTQVFILTAYPQAERGSIMGMFGLAVSAAPVLSPTLAGIIIDLAGWQMIFWGAVAFSLAVLVLAVFVMKNTTEPQQVKFDFASLLLCSVGYVGIVLGLGNWSRYAFASVHVLLPILFGIAAIALFSGRQLKLDKPFLNIRVFANSEFRLAVIASMLLYAGMIAVAVLLPIYIQSLRGISATISGLVTMPGSLITALVSPIAGRKYDKIGIRKLYIIGSALVLAGHAALVFITDSTSLILIAGLFIIRQIGIGMLLMTTVTWGMSGLDKSFTADGTALISSMRTVAGAIGAAAFVSIMSAVAGSDKTEAMLSGMKVSFAGIAVMSAVVFLLAVLKIGRKRKSI